MNEFDEQLEYALELFSTGLIYPLDIENHTLSCSGSLHCKGCKLSLPNGCFGHVYREQFWEALEEKLPESLL